MKTFPNFAKRLYPEQQPAIEGAITHQISKATTIFVDPETLLYEGCPDGDSLMVIPKKNYFRRKAYLLVTNKYFETFIIFIIILSAVTLALETPISDPNSQMQYVLY